jgi:GDP-L-fucose synthase
MVGSALRRRLVELGAEVLTVSRQDCDLRDQSQVRGWIAKHRPEAIIVAAGLVGGIQANRTRPAEFLYDNLLIAANIIKASAACEVRKLLYLGSSCIYPREAPQPVEEEHLLSGPFEPTNEWYALAKVTGIKLCQAFRRQYGHDFIAAVPTNLYGPGDNFDAINGHVIPALMRRLHEARLQGALSVDIWGTGRAQREFLYVEDAADALCWLMENYSAEEIINVAGGQSVNIAELAALLAGIVGYSGEFHFDPSKPDGIPRKVLSAARIRALGWQPKIALQEGLRRTYEWFLNHSVKSAPAGVT